MTTIPVRNHRLPAASAPDGVALPPEADVVYHILTVRRHLRPEQALADIEIAKAGARTKLGIARVAYGDPCGTIPRANRRAGVTHLTKPGALLGQRENVIAVVVHKRILGPIGVDVPSAIYRLDGTCIWRQPS